MYAYIPGGNAAHSAPKERPHPVDQQTRASLKQDNYVTVTSHGLDWASQNRRSVIVSAAILLVVILIAVAAGVLYTNRSEKASIAFGAAMQAYQTPLAPAGQPVPPGVKTFPSVEARAMAANALFLQVADQYGMTAIGKNARYFAGLTAVEAGQNASAESTLNQVASGWNHDLANLARLALAQLYRETGRDLQAIDQYNQITRKPSVSVPAGTAQLQLAELYAGENKPDEARRIYAQLKDKDAKGPAGLIAAQKLNPAAAAAPPTAE